MVNNRLFFGGGHMVGIESITLLEGHFNFANITKLLFCFDIILSGGFAEAQIWSEIQQKHVKILKHLIDLQLKDEGNANKKKLHSYIYDTFNALIRNKEEIHISTGQIMAQEANQEMIDMILHPIEREAKNVESVTDNPRGRGDMSNLFKKDLLRIFKYTPKIVMVLDPYYKISLWSLLSVIEQSSLQEIVLQIGEQHYYDKLMKIYPVTTELRERYSEANYNIGFIQNTGPWQSYVNCVISSTK